MTPEIKITVQSIESLLEDLETNTQAVEDDGMVDLMKELGRLKDNIRTLSSDVSSLSAVVSAAGTNLVTSPESLIADMDSQDVEERVSAMFRDSAADLLGIPVSANQIDALIKKLQVIPPSPPPFPTGLQAKLAESIGRPGTVLVEEVNNRITETSQALKDGHAQIRKIPEKVFGSLEQTLNGRIAELEGSFTETIELGEELMEQLGGGVSDLFDRAETAVSNLVDAWGSLADVWSGMNDDLPEAKGTLGDVQVAVEDTKYVVDEVVDMI